MRAKKQLWQECLKCKDKCCCRGNLSFPLFLTSEEKKIKGINSSNPCKFFNKEGLCDIYHQRPFDCRFFPFDIFKINGKFFWMIWKINGCSIARDRNKFELYLKEHEQELITGFKQYLDEYDKFRTKEMLNKYQYEILREMRLHLAVSPPSGCQ